MCSAFHAKALAVGGVSKQTEVHGQRAVVNSGMHCDGFRTAESLAARGWMDAEANGDVTLSTLHLEDSYGPSEHRNAQEGAWLAAQQLHANHLGGMGSMPRIAMEMPDIGRNRRQPVPGTLQSWWAPANTNLFPPQTGLRKRM